MHTQWARNFNRNAPAPCRVDVGEISHKRNHMRYSGFRVSSSRLAPSNVLLGKSFEFSQDDKGASSWSCPVNHGQGTSSVSDPHYKFPSPKAPSPMPRSTEPPVSHACSVPSLPPDCLILSSSPLQHQDRKLQVKESGVLVSDSRASREPRETPALMEENRVGISSLLLSRC